MEGARANARADRGQVAFCCNYAVKESVVHSTAHTRSRMDSLIDHNQEAASSALDILQRIDSFLAKLLGM